MNIDSKLRVNPRVPGGDDQYELDDRLIESFDTCDGSNATCASNAASNLDSNIGDEACEHE